MNKKRKYQQGGLWSKNKTAYADSVLSANKNLDWVQRLYEENPQTIQIPGQPYPSTHFMGDNNQGYVFPTVIRNQQGQLEYLGDGAEDYARETNTGIQLPKEQGTWFGRNGYKQGTGVLQKKQNGGWSIQGYASDSPDKNRDFNIIPGGNITMKKTNKKLYAQDNLGNSAILQPGYNYQFPGQYVTEYPVMADGGIHIKKSARGSLHTALGVPQGEKIPADKLQIHEGDSPALRKKKQFAINAAGWKKQFGGPITDIDRENWNNMQTQAYQQGYLGNDHSKVPGQQFMQQYGIDPGRLQAYQQDFQSFSQSDPGRIHTGPEISKVDDIYGHRTAKQRYVKYQYDTKRVNPQTHQYETYNSINTGVTPMSTEQWDNKLAGIQPQIQQPMVQPKQIPMSSRTPQENGFLSKEQAINNKKARGNNPDNWYMQQGGQASIQGFQPNQNSYTNPWQTQNPNDLNTMAQVYAPVQNTPTVPINNFDGPVPQQPIPQVQQQPYNWQQWGQVAAAHSQLQDTVNNTAEAFVDYFGNKKANRDLQKRNQWLGSSENMYKQQMYDKSSAKGDYVTTGTAYGQFRPQLQGFKGMYKGGGTWAGPNYYEMGGQLPQGKFGMMETLALPMLPSYSNSSINAQNSAYPEEMTSAKPIMTTKEVQQKATQARDYLMSQGLRKHEAAGIVGNLMQESGMNAAITNSIGAFGTAQWLGPRKKNLINWAANNNRNPQDMYTQLDYILQEPGESAKMLNALKKTQNASQAARTFSQIYERPGKAEANNHKRAGYAEQLMFKVGGQYELTDLEIAAIEKAGGKIRYID